MGTVQHPLMRIAEVAEILDVSKAHVYGMVHAGVIPHSRITPRSIRVPRGAFADWLAEQNRQARESVGSTKTNGTPASVPLEEGRDDTSPRPVAA